MRMLDRAAVRRINRASTTIAGSSTLGEGPVQAE
jgi:hypothetical protein